MHYLDEVPLDYSKPETQELHEVLYLAYPSQTRIKQLVAKVGFGEYEIPFANTARDLWFELMRNLSDQGKLRKTIENAANDPSSSAYQQRFKELLSSTPAVAVPGQTSFVNNTWKGNETSETVLQIYTEGRSRLFPIALIDKIREKSHSVARLTLRYERKTAYGTGFLVYPNVLLTCEHNLFNEEFGFLVGIDVTFETKPTLSPDMHTISLSTNYLESGDVIHANAQNDWAIVRLPDEIQGREPITLGSPYNPQIAGDVIIIQHPRGASMQFALDPLSIQHVDDQLIYYLADTQVGSSGAPVFDSEMNLIALHRATEKASIVSNGTPITYWRNIGTNIEVVSAFLKSHKFTDG